MKTESRFFIVKLVGQVCVLVQFSIYKQRLLAENTPALFEMHSLVARQQ